MADIISIESKILLDLLANSLFDAKTEIDLKDVNLERLFTEAKSQTVLALAFDSLPTIAREQNPEIYDKWQNYSFSVMRKNVNQMHSNASLERLFAEYDLPICTIKGFASNYYYEKKHLRQMGDIDFIVPVERLEEYKKVLSENEFECIDKDGIHEFHIGYKKNQELYEMHKGITSFSDENGYIEKYIKNIFENTFVADFGNVKITIPDIFAHGLIMLLHMQRHMIDGGGVGFRHLSDWATFVNTIDNDKWINIFEKKLKSINIWEFARALSKVSSLYLQMPEKEWFSQYETSLAEELMLDIVMGGNFGRKDIGRSQELLFLTQKDRNDSKIIAFVKSYIRKVYSWKRFYKEHKYLLPVGMVVYFFRTSFLIVFGKKKVNIVQTYKNGTKRSNLYDSIFK